MVHFLPSSCRPTTEPASVRAERKVRDMREESGGTAEGKQTAPALLDMKPHSGFWLILLESGGGAGGVMLSNQSTTLIRNTLGRNIDPWNNKRVKFQIC